jgi:1-deoxy-D-xylulose-5-phosphate synthase
MHIIAPKNKWELSDMLKYAVDFEGPIAIRYPRGEAYDGLKRYRYPIEYGKSETIYDESDIALLAVGSMVKTAKEVREELKEIGYNCSLVNARFVKPIDEDNILELVGEHKLIVTLEENVKNGGYGEKVLQFISEYGIKINILIIAIPDEYVEHGNVEILKKEVGIDKESIIKRIISAYVKCIED